MLEPRQSSSPHLVYLFPAPFWSPRSISCLFWTSQYSLLPLLLCHHYPPFIFFSQAPALGPSHYHQGDKYSVYFHLGCCRYIVRPPYFVHCTEHCLTSNT